MRFLEKADESMNLLYSSETVNSTKQVQDWQGARQVWHSHGAAQLRTRGQGMSSGAALQPKSVGCTRGGSGWGISQFFFTAWLFSQKPGSRQTPSTLMGRGEFAQED